MNVILILDDTFRRDYLGCYGNPWIKTPNLDRLAASSAIFDRNYIASYASVPARTDIYTGCYTFLHRGTSPLQPQDVILQEVLGEYGCTSMFILDLVSLAQDDGNFMRGFSGWDFVRGHHLDRWRTDPNVPIKWPAAPHKLKNLKNTIQYMRNKADWRGEEDYVAPRTFKTAIEWLERNHTLNGFLLSIDTLDPHEPFDPPPNYVPLYADPAYAGEQVIYPQYGHSTYMSDDELKHVKALYAGEVTMVDRWIGILLDTVEHLGLLDNTMIIHTSDHGHLFGEHSLEGKPGGLLGNLYEVTTRIPLMIRHPLGVGAGQRVSTIVQPQDLSPTILDFLGIPIPKAFEGQSLLSLMTGDKLNLHDYAFSGRFPSQLVNHGKGSTSEEIGWYGDAGAITVTDDAWSLICSPRGRHSELYDLGGDPEQRKDVIAEHPQVAATMQQALLEFMWRFGAPQALVDLYSPPIGEMITPTDGPPSRLESEDTLYRMQDQRGQFIAFRSIEEARKVTASDTLELEPKTFDWIRTHDPQALIYMDGQYYWAEDLG